MTTMTIIVLVVVLWALFVVGVLVGISVHRETTRRRTHRLDVEQRDLERERLETRGERR